MSAQDDERYIIRLATFEDIGWIISLAEELAEVTVSPLQGVWGEKARVFARESIQKLVPFIASNGYKFLVCLDKHSSLPVGYLILNMFHESPYETRETYIEDMGVVSGYLGRRVPHFLVGEASRISAEEGVDFMGAHISCLNQRALLTALNIGFELESYRIVMPCTSQAREVVEGSSVALERQSQLEKNRRVIQSRRLKRSRRQQKRAEKPAGSSES